MNLKNTNRHVIIQVSVPLRGLHFSNDLKQVAEAQEMFPSPCGDCISQIEGMNVPVLNWMFPSPCGDCISQIGNEIFCHATGYEFPSPCGDCISQIVKEKYLMSMNPEMFPSPCGDCISQIKISELPNIASVFPSPCGDCISQIFFKVFYCKNGDKSFRPLAGTAFLKSLIQF